MKVSTRTKGNRERERKRVRKIDIRNEMERKSDKGNKIIEIK